MGMGFSEPQHAPAKPQESLTAVAGHDFPYPTVLNPDGVFSRETGGLINLEDQITLRGGEIYLYEVNGGGSMAVVPLQLMGAGKVALKNLRLNHKECDEVVRIVYVIPNAGVPWMWERCKSGYAYHNEATGDTRAPSLIFRQQ
jgi:hypothetical protein